MVNDDQNNSQQNQSQGQNQPLAAGASPFDAATQQKLNEPLSHPQGLGQNDEIFLNMLLDKIDRKEIDLYRPSSLLNLPVYEKLSEEAQGKAELDAFQLLATIREIYRLCKSGYRTTYQVENLTKHIRVTKERLEQFGGDIFVI